MDASHREPIDDDAPVVPVLERSDAASWRRVAARLVDLAVVVMLVWVLAVLQVLGVLERAAGDTVGPAGTAIAAGAVLATVLEAVFVVHSRGQTPGKDLMRVRVIGRSTERVGWTVALLRWTPLAVLVAVRPWWLAVAVAALLAVAVLANPRWAVTDLVGRTRVVPYDRDREDPDARRPSSRRQRRAARNEIRGRGELRVPSGGTRDLAER